MERSSGVQKPKHVFSGYLGGKIQTPLLNLSGGEKKGAGTLCQQTSRPYMYSGVLEMWRGAAVVGTSRSAWLARCFSWAMGPASSSRRQAPPRPGGPSTSPSLNAGVAQHITAEGGIGVHLIWHRPLVAEFLVNTFSSHFF